jgi:hypothetical protein
MFAKLFAILETVQLLKDLWELALVEYHKYVINNYGEELDKNQAQRNAYLDAIELAQKDKDVEKIKSYSRLLATLGVPKL